jgi:hypothetical protein
LAATPEFTPNPTGWTEDSLEQQKAWLIRVHEPFGIISLHIYPDRGKGPSASPGERQYQNISVATSVGQPTGKLVFIGEFGDDGAAPGSEVSPFIRRIAEYLVEKDVRYAAFWEWEYTSKSLDQDIGTEPQAIDPANKSNFVKLLRHVIPGENSAAPSGLSSDAARPHVVLTWPLPCAAIDRPIMLLAVASVAAGPVDHVEFLLDGKPIGIKNEPPYRIQFDPSSAGSRLAVIEARAFVTSGMFSSYLSPVLLNADTGHCQVPAD